MIPSVDQALERMLRAEVPLPAELVDLSFDAPDASWGAQLSRVTVNLFLFDVARSPLPPQPPASRTRDDGRVELRPPLPLVKLSYLVSAWAGNTSDEHQVLGDILACLIAHDALPSVHVPAGLAGTVQLSLGQRDGRKPGDLWSSLNGKVKPAFELGVTVALEGPWRLAAPAVTSVAGLVAPQPEDPGGVAVSSRSSYSSRSAGTAVTRRRRVDGAVVSDAAAAAPAED